MLEYLKGQIVSKKLDSLVLDVNNIGYSITMASSSISEIGHTGDSAIVYVYMNVSDSGIALYGFINQSDKEFFEKLITVSGVGPKIAIAAISTLGAQGLSDAIAAQDTAKISSVPGIGKKGASRIILELKDAVSSSDNLSSNSIDAANLENIEITKAALLSMGFTTIESDLALNGAPESATDKELLQYALKRLGNK